MHVPQSRSASSPLFRHELGTNDVVGVASATMYCCVVSNREMSETFSLGLATRQLSKAGEDSIGGGREVDINDLVKGATRTAQKVIVPAKTRLVGLEIFLA